MRALSPPVPWARTLELAVGTGSRSWHQEVAAWPHGEGSSTASWMLGGATSTASCDRGNEKAGCGSTGVRRSIARRQLAPTVHAAGRMRPPPPAGEVSGTASDTKARPPHGSGDARRARAPYRTTPQGHRHHHGHGDVVRGLVRVAIEREHVHRYHRDGYCDRPADDPDERRQGPLKDERRRRPGSDRRQPGRGEVEHQHGHAEVRGADLGFATVIPNHARETPR